MFPQYSDTLCFVLWLTNKCLVHISGSGFLKSDFCVHSNSISDLFQPFFLGKRFSYAMVLFWFVFNLYLGFLQMPLFCQDKSINSTQKREKQLKNIGMLLYLFMLQYFHLTRINGYLCVWLYISGVKQKKPSNLELADSEMPEANKQLRLSDCIFIFQFIFQLLYQVPTTRTKHQRLIKEKVQTPHMHEWTLAFAYPSWLNQKK